MSALTDPLIYTVGEAVSKVRASLEKNFPFIWVRGEVAEFSRSATGHLYFALKDEHNRLKCVWFSGRQKGACLTCNPLTGECYDTPRPAPGDYLQNGLEIICAGQITFFNAGGVCQLSVEFAEPTGAGALALAFEQLKARLAALGFFEKSRKRQLPWFPKKVALITSPTGAAIHDFLEIAQNRGLGAKIRLFPVPVQGLGAAEKVAKAIIQAGSQNWADVIVVIRGGGSPEDLWTFNEECVATAIFQSPVPVLAGIGHEIDISLADLTADRRAATPTHAAQILFCPREELWQKLDSLEAALLGGIKALVERKFNQLERQEKLAGLLHPAKRLYALSSAFSGLEKSLRQLYANLLNTQGMKLDRLDSSLNFHKPDLKIISRKLGSLRLLEEKTPMSFRQIISQKNAALENTANILYYQTRNRIDRMEARLGVLDAELGALNPLAPLSRGYALLYSNGKLIKSAASMKPGQELEAVLADGRIGATVQSVDKKQEAS